MAVGNVVQVGNALVACRMDWKTTNYNQATKLTLKSASTGAADVGVADDYRVFDPIEVIENWIGHVVDMSGFSFDASAVRSWMAR